jgi:hypothetical protein
MRKMYTTLREEKVIYNDYNEGTIPWDTIPNYSYYWSDLDLVFLIRTVRIKMPHDDNSGDKLREFRFMGKYLFQWDINYEW